MSTDRWMDKNVVCIHKGILLSHNKEKGKTEDEMVGWHHWLNGYEFEQTWRRCKRQGSPACCSPWGYKELDMTERPNNKWKMNAVMPLIATWMDLQIMILSKISQKKTNTIWYHLYVQPKIWHSWTYLRNRRRLNDIENRLVVVSVEGE